MHTFYLNCRGAVGAILPLDADEAKHALKVLRLTKGDEIRVLDDSGARFSACMEDDSGLVRITELLPSNESDITLIVCQGLPKSDKLEFAAQKLTELGASALIPVKMARCVVKSDEKDGKKRQERLDKIAREAAKQCARGVPMTVSVPLTWKQTVEKLSDCDLVLVPWEDARGTRLKDVYATRPNAKKIAVIIGPEGGMTPEEVEQSGAIPVTLGPRILRTETAVVAAASVIMSLWGDI